MRVRVVMIGFLWVMSSEADWGHRQYAECRPTVELTRRRESKHPPPHQSKLRNTLPPLPSTELFGVVVLRGPRYSRSREKNNATSSTPASPGSYSDVSNPHQAKPILR